MHRRLKYCSSSEFLHSISCLLFSLVVIQVEWRQIVVAADTDKIASSSFNQHYEALGQEMVSQAASILKPKFLYFAEQAPLVGQELITVSKDDTPGTVSAAPNKAVNKIESRIGSKYWKFKKTRQSGGGGGGNSGGDVESHGGTGTGLQMFPSDQDIFASIGTILGMLGLGILFIAEVSSSFGAPILIPILSLPLGLVVLLRLMYSNEMLASMHGNGGSGPNDCVYFCT